MFYALKITGYMGWYYKVFQYEKDAIQNFQIEMNAKDFKGNTAVQLFKMKHAFTKCRYPIFIPTHKYKMNNRRSGYTWIKIKKDIKRR